MLQELITDKPLDPWQDEALSVAFNGRRTVVALDAGLGKSRVAIELINRTQFKRVLVVCSKSALATWRKEPPKWSVDRSFAFANVTIEGSPASREALWKPHASGTYLHVVSFGTFQSDVLGRTVKGKFIPPRIKRKWSDVYDYLIVDEADKLSNRKTKNFEAVKELKDIPWITFLTGTPVNRGPQDLWTLFNIINPKLFSSYWRYVNTFCEVVDGYFGKEIIGPKNMEGFKRTTRGFFFSMTKDEVSKKYGQALPPKRRLQRWTEMTPEQSKLYNLFANHMMAELSDGSLVVASTSMTALLRLRQTVVCPAILDPAAGVGGAFEFILDELDNSSNKTAAIFTPYAEAFPYFIGALQKRGHKNIYTLRGGTSSEEVERVTNAMRTVGGIVLNTVKFARAYEFETVPAAYFTSAEWSVVENDQAENRCHRRSSTGSVDINYVLTSNSVDESLVEIVDRKARSIDLTRMSLEDLRKLIRGTN